MNDVRSVVWAHGRPPTWNGNRTTFCVISSEAASAEREIPMMRPERVRGRRDMIGAAPEGFSGSRSLS